VELTIDCKVVYGFDLSLSKTFPCLLFLCRRVLALVWFFSKGGFGKDDLRGEVFLEVVFMVKNLLNAFFPFNCLFIP